MLLAAFSGLSQAATMSFGLNENNIGSLGNTIDYATVTISDGAVAGDIDFVIDINNDFFNEGTDFGIQSFYFNSSLIIAPGNIILDPNNPMFLGNPDYPGWLNPNWALMSDFGPNPDDGFQVSEFGRFDLSYRGTDNIRQPDALAFTIRASGADLMTYALDNLKGFAFAAHIAGFNNVSGADSGWFAGSTELSPVPVPAAFWLFGTALIGLIGFSRRRTV